MNLNNLSQAQAELDLLISREKSLHHEDYLKEKAIALCVELGELLNERPFIFKYWSNKTGGRDKALTEYVDGLHFLLSFGNAIKFDFEKYEYVKPKEVDQRELILGLFNMFAVLPTVRSLDSALTFYLMLAEKLRFSFEEIEECYFRKNKINLKRQETGY